MNLSTIILKNGINSLIYESDDSFKKSLINSLSFKLNEAVKEVKKEFSSKILISKETIDVDKNVSIFLEFVENYNSKTNKTLKCKNGVTININENDLSKIKVLFDSLNSKNKKIMVKELLEDQAGLKKTLEFLFRYMLYAMQDSTLSSESE